MRLDGQIKTGHFKLLLDGECGGQASLHCEDVQLSL